MEKGWKIGTLGRSAGTGQTLLIVKQCVGGVAIVATRMNTVMNVTSAKDG